MKILKPGKVEQRKFVCPNCGCEFVADSSTDITWHQYNGNKDAIACPCGKLIGWDKGEPYEGENVDSPSERLRMFNLFIKSPPPAATWDLVDYLTEKGIGFKNDN